MGCVYMHSGVTASRAISGKEADAMERDGYCKILNKHYFFFSGSCCGTVRKPFGRRECLIVIELVSSGQR